MTRLYVVTHPEATHHVDGLVGGWFDSALTERGLARAAELAAEVRALVPEGARVDVTSSDLTRTVQTATVVAERLGVPVAQDRGLREKSYGVAEGRPQAWLDERFVFPPEHGDRLDHHEGIEGAETRRDLGTRVYAALERVLGGEAEHHVVVTHGFALTYVVAGWIGMPLEATGQVAFRAPSGSVTVLEQDAPFHNRAVAL